MRRRSHKANLYLLCPSIWPACLTSIWQAAWPHPSPTGNSRERARLSVAPLVLNRVLNHV